MTALPRGRRMAVDVGAVRVGVATSDPDGLVATPVITITRGQDPGAFASFRERLDQPDAAVTLDDAPADLGQLIGFVEELDAAVIYVGYPRQLSGAEGAAAQAAEEYAYVLSRLLSRTASEPEVRLVDERMTTVTAHAELRAAGRKTRSHRPVVDQAAAVVIMRTALEGERLQGVRAGVAVGGCGGAR